MIPKLPFERAKVDLSQREVTMALAIQHICTPSSEPSSVPKFRALALLTRVPIFDMLTKTEIFAIYVYASSESSGESVHFCRLT